MQSTTGIQTNQRGLLTVNEDGSTTREGVFAGGDAVMGARTVVEAVAIAKKVAESMDSYMKSLPKDHRPGPLCGHPGFQHSHLGRARPSRASEPDKISASLPWISVAGSFCKRFLRLCHS